MGELPFVRALSILVALAACSTDGGRGRGPGFVDSVGIAIRDPASWPTMTFVPHGTEIDSVPLRAIDTTWSLATPLDVSMLPSHDSLGPLGVSGSVGFQVDQDFNGDGVPDRARVGVYRDTTGNEGSFLLILTRSPRGGWARAFVATEPGEPRFSILVNDKTGLIWAECLTCGRWRPVSWSGERYELGPLVEPETQ